MYNIEMNIEFEIILKIEDTFYKKEFTLEDFSEASSWLVEDWRIEVLEEHHWIKWEDIEKLSFDEYRRLFTGLIDANWIKIYNWDIIKGKNWYNCLIVFDNKQLCFRAQWIKKELWFTNFLENWEVYSTSEKVTSNKKYIVLWNMYKNPELLIL